MTVVLANHPLPLEVTLAFAAPVLLAIAALVAMTVRDRRRRQPR